MTGPGINLREIDAFAWREHHSCAAQHTFMPCTLRGGTLSPAPPAKLAGNLVLVVHQEAFPQASAQPATAARAAAEAVDCTLLSHLANEDYWVRASGPHCKQHVTCQKAG